MASAIVSVTTAAQLRGPGLRQQSLHPLIPSCHAIHHTPNIRHHKLHSNEQASGVSRKVLVEAHNRQKDSLGHCP